MAVYTGFNVLGKSTVMSQEHCERLKQASSARDKLESLKFGCGKLEILTGQQTKMVLIRMCMICI